MFKKLVSWEFTESLKNFFSSVYIPFIVIGVILFILIKIFTVIFNNLEEWRKPQKDYTPSSYISTVNRSETFKSICEERNGYFDDSAPGIENELLIGNCLRSQWQENLTETINKIIEIRNKFKVLCSQKKWEVVMPEDSNLYRDCILKDGTKISQELYNQINIQ